MADQGREGLLSPLLRIRRLQAARPWLRGRVLDYGCGAGMMAEHVDRAHYLGIDIDLASLERAQRDHPGYRFSIQPPDPDERFDTVVLLAVIEHVPEPDRFLYRMASYLCASPAARVVLTTPHPTLDFVHSAGAALRLFSRHASEEHEQLLDRRRLSGIGAAAGVELIHYERFLLGANQLAVFRRMPS